jgi:zinc protease
MITKRLAWALLLAALACKTPPPEGPTPPTNKPATAPVTTPEKKPSTEPPKAADPGPVFPKDAFRKTPPTPAKVHDFKAPSIAQFKLKNGIEVYLVERHQLPIVSMQLLFEGGAVSDPPKKAGLAGLCMGLVGDGTQKLDRVAYEEVQADLASGVGAFAGDTQQGVTMNTLSRNLDATLDLWADTILHPGLRKEDFELDQKQTLTSIEEAKSAPDSIAFRVFGSIAYGEAHPYGLIETEATVKAITLDDCKKYVAKTLKPEGARLYVLGDITQAQIEEKVVKRLEGWKGKAPAPVKVAAPKPRKGRIFFVDVPEAAQSMVLIMEHGPKRQAADYFPTSIMSGILGGSFASRINMNIREKNGYAYGAYGGFFYRREGGVFFTSASVRTDATKPAILEMIKELQGMREGDVTDEELSREKEGAILGLPAQWETGGSTLGTFRDLIYYGLPLNYYDSFVDNIQKVTKADVRKAATDHVQLDKMQYVVVGDAKTVLPELKALLESKALGAGELVVLDADGKVLKQ